MLKTAEFPTKFIVSPKRRPSDVVQDYSSKSQLPRFALKPLVNEMPADNTASHLPPSVLLREQEQAQHKQASQKEARKRAPDLLASSNSFKLESKATQQTSYSNKTE